ncbi:eukaryotic translation initiation factor [Ascoidea rubescens DSM 1968]|uniref:Eukaryotic translation initiation factor 3 subunit H n=1 Tax=Ascoidea rubescens DSM 1968 TaxID=1344418 RepID=A0A1D2VQP9_9ASCO|nr:eukaryotic translation initiation factor [Ascoidea rubescens DSM 1968]ODV63934.1 eukaryotic translation initiation factor [Ascoidea rubescens DSM 1968]
MSNTKQVKEFSTPTTNVVQIESSVALKIIKHATDYYPTLVSGPLLGVDKDETLTVSHSFPYSIYNESIEGSSFKLKTNQRFQNELLELSKNTGVAAQFIGWYQCSVSSNFFNNHIIDSLLSLQRSNPNAILIIHDSSKINTNSVLSLRAFRLSEAFLNVYKAANNSTNKFSTALLLENNLTHENIFEELPVSIHNSHLVSLMLHQLLSENESSLNTQDYNQIYKNNDIVSNSFDSLSLNNSKYSTGIIDKLFDSVDSYHYDLNNYNYYQRQLSRELQKIQQWKAKSKIENANRVKNGQKEIDLENDWKSIYKLPNEPQRFTNLLVSASITGFCKDLEVNTTSELIKSFAIQKGLDI